MTKYKVLIVDDEVWVRENLRSLLTAEEGSLSVLEPAADGEAALARVALEKPDILITDIDMPFLNGNELIKAAKILLPALQVIVLSGYSDFDYVRQALVDGAIDYLLKPVVLESLLRVVEKAVSNLQGRLTREQELAQQTETLQRAASLVRDEALSALLQDDRPPEVTQNEVGEPDFEFAVFTLLLVKLVDLPLLLREHGENPARLEAKVKALASREASDQRTMVFHNLRVRNEFLLLTDRDSVGVDRLGRRLAENLERFTGSRTDVAISSPFYSFGKLRQAYREAKAGLLMRTADDRERIVSFEAVRRRPIQGRLTPELERLLALAVDAEDKALIREVVFDRIGLARADDWLLVEVKQTAETLAGMMFQYAQARSARSSLALEAFHTLLTCALETRDLSEVCSLLERWINEFFGSEAAGTSSTMKQTVRKVQDYIAEKYCENLSLTTLAQVFRVDAAYLSKAFKQVTGSNLMGAIAQKRIEKAEEYIRERNLSLTEVASLVGYGEYAYFNRVFHKLAGVSPRDYRNRYRKVPS